MGQGFGAVEKVVCSDENLFDCQHFKHLRGEHSLSNI